MQAVILAAGKGTRMEQLTSDLPKPLIPLNGKPLLTYKLEALPKIIDEVVIVIGYHGEKIREQYGNNFNTIRITYIEDTTLTGTAHALWHAKKILKDRFLVMMGDDIYSTETMEQCAQYDFSVACKLANPNEDGSRALLNEKDELIDFVTWEKYRTLRDDAGYIVTGLYSLTTDIFQYEPVKLKTKEEWGLPQTILSANKDHPVTLVQTNFWISVSNKNDLEQGEKSFLHV